MKIIIHKQELTDHSAVFDVQLLSGKDQITLPAPSEIKAREVAAQIRDAMNECLDEVIETIMEY